MAVNKKDGNVMTWLNSWYAVLAACALVVVIRGGLLLAGLRVLALIALVACWVLHAILRAAYSIVDRSLDGLAEFCDGF